MQPYSLVTPQSNAIVKAHHTLAPLAATAEHKNCLAEIYASAPEHHTDPLFAMELDETTTLVAQVGFSLLRGCWQSVISSG